MKEQPIAPATPAPATTPASLSPAPAPAINKDVPPAPAEVPSPDSPPASERGSQPASGGTPFIEEPGPAFDPETAEAPPLFEEEEAEEPFEVILWTEESTRRWLLLQGEVTHGFIGVAEIDWKHTEADLVSIAGPLSRILNRYPTTRAVAMYDDPLSVAFGFGMYAVRSGNERRRALAARAAEEEPVTGVPAPADMQPPAPPAPPAGPQPPAPPVGGGEELDWTLGQ